MKHCRTCFECYLLVCTVHVHLETFDFHVRSLVYSLICVSFIGILIKAGLHVTTTIADKKSAVVAVGIK